MKIYFSGSIKGGRENQAMYFEIIARLKKYGEVLTEHIGEKNLGQEGQKVSDKVVFKTDVDFLDKADVVVAEVSTPSLGVGYEIGVADGKKPILCLANKDGISFMISGNPNLTLRKYETRQ